MPSISNRPKMPAVVNKRGNRHVGNHIRVAVMKSQAMAAKSKI